MRIDLRLVDSVRQHLDHLSKSERQIARRLIEDPTGFANSSLGKIADDVGVSQPTVVRFCRNVGFEGFKDFKIRLGQDLAVERAFRDTPPAHSPEVAQGSLLDPLRQGIVKLIDQTIIDLDRGAMAAAVDAIAGSERIMIYGLGGSSAAVASEAQNRFFRLGLNCWACSDSYMQRMTAATCSNKDLVLIVSSTGKPRSLLDCIELARQRECPTLALAPQSSALGAGADLCLNVALESVEVPYYQPSPVRYAQLFLIDSLALHVAVKMGERCKQNLKRIHGAVTAIHGVLPSQPIGD